MPHDSLEVVPNLPRNSSRQHLEMVEARARLSRSGVPGLLQTASHADIDMPHQLEPAVASCEAMVPALLADAWGLGRPSRRAC